MNTKLKSVLWLGIAYRVCSLAAYGVLTWVASTINPLAAGAVVTLFLLGEGLFLYQQKLVQSLSETTSSDVYQKMLDKLLDDEVLQYGKEV